MSDHLSTDQIRDFIIGAEVGMPVDQFRTHLASCRECSAQLQAEAQLDHTMWEVRQAVTACPGCQRLLLDRDSSDRCDHCGAIRRVREFTTEAVLTQTGHGRVYLARAASGQAVALKELVFAQVPSMSVLDAFEREAKILRQLDHPRIPRLVAHFQEGEGVHTRLYLAQEYVAGTSLQALLDNHRFDENEAIDVARQVLAVLTYLQSLSPAVFHRDIKPANLIRRPDGKIALVDFGSARELGATQGATLVGTVGYMPPEQLTGIVDKTTDLYALGATLIHLLTRRPPWQILTIEPLARRVQGTRQLRSYLERLVATNPRDRFADASQALQALNLMSTGIARRRRNVKFALFGVAALVVAPLTWQTANLVSEQRAKSKAQQAVARLAARAMIWAERPQVVDEIYRQAHQLGLEPQEVHELWPYSTVIDDTATSDALARAMVNDLNAEMANFRPPRRFVLNKIERLSRRFAALRSQLAQVDLELDHLAADQLAAVKKAFQQSVDDGSSLAQVTAAAGLLQHMIEAGEKEVNRAVMQAAESEEGAASEPDTAIDDHAEYAYLRGNRLLLQGRFLDAVSAFRDAIEIDPRFADAYRGLGIAYAKLGKAELATRHYELYVQLRAKAPDADRVREIIREYRAIEANER